MNSAFLVAILVLLLAIVAAFYIVERKRQVVASLELQRQNEEIRYLLRHGKLGLWYYTPADDRFTPSTEWFSLMGCENQSCVGLREKFYQHIAPYDRDRVSQSFAHFISQRQPIYHEKFQLNTMHSRSLWIEDFGHILLRDDEGNPLKFMGISRDITAEMDGLTDQQRREAQLQALSSGEKVEFWDWDISLDQITVDPLFSQKKSHHQPGKYRSKAFFGEIHPDDWAQIEEKIKEFISGKASFLHCDFRHKNSGLKTESKKNSKDESWQWMRVMAVTYLRDLSGHPQKAAGINFDINQQRQTADQLAEDEIKLKALKLELQSKEEELNQVSHSLLHSILTLGREVRSPLNVSLGIVEELRGKEQDKHKSELLEQLKISSKLIFKIVNEIVDLMRLQTQEFHLESVPIDLRRMIGHVFFEGIEDLSSDKLFYPESVSSNIYGDSKRMKQILKDCRDFLNSGDTSPSLFVQLELIYMDGQPFLSIVLKNPLTQNMRDDTRNKMLIEHNLQDNDKSRERSIGLTIAEKMIKLMEGSLSIENSSIAGNCVKIILPYRPHDQGAEITSAKIYDRQLLMAKNSNVLIVDDSEANRELIRIYLSDYPITCFMAKDGVEAVQLFQREIIDLIVMDIQMPNMDGREATQIIRNIEKVSHRTKVPIIALSAFVLHEEIDQCLAEGCSSVLVKPVKKGVLLDEMVKQLS